MTEDVQSDDSGSRAASAEQIDELRNQFEMAWKAGDNPRIEDFIDQCEGRLRDQLFAGLLRLEISLVVEDGTHPVVDDYANRFPNHLVTVRDVFARQDPSPESALRLPVSSSDWSASESPIVSHEAVDSRKNDPQPKKIGRYSIHRRLASGGFGNVYLARDDDLGRLVAIKIPYDEHFVNFAELDEFLSEARIAASLDHPNIVPVYDVGRINDRTVFIVSKYIEGTTLASCNPGVRATPAEAVELIAPIADALDYAHRQLLVHRDIKPENILIDETGTPFVADFGLAIRAEQQREHVGDKSGTACYMSPEQARGEAHRLDGRTDIWSLGVVLYELLTGKRPFEGKSRDEVLDEVLHREAKPLRQIDDAIPEALDQICMRCLAKPIGERYPTAGELAADLRRAAATPGTRWKAASTAATLLVMLVIGGIWWSGRVDQPVEESSVALQHGMQVWVWQNDQKRELAGAVPLRSGDDLQISFVAPTGMHVGLFWYDTERKLHKLPVQGWGETVRGTRYIWPGSGKSNVLAGPAGTEIVLVCESRDAEPTVSQLQPILDGMESWSGLRTSAVLKIAPDSVQMLGDRGPSPHLRPRPDGVVIEQGEDLRRRLAETFDAFVGFAFAHIDNANL